MQRQANPGKPRRASKLPAWLAAAALGLGGCSSTQHSATTLGDPLLGPALSPAPAATPVHAATPQGNGLPPIPQNAGLSTNAALASQSSQPHSLAIGQGTGWARKVDGATTPGLPVSQPKVEPVPKDAITAPSTAAIKQAGFAATSQPTPPSTEQLDQQLKAHGVVAQEQEREGTGLCLKVVVANPANPNSVDNLSTTAPDYATAVAAILQQIDAKRAHP